MKRTLLAMFLAGCTTTQPAKRPAIEVVVVQLPIPRTKGEMVEVIEVEEPFEVRHTWMTGDEIEHAKKERLIKDHPECDCQPGDPLCSCIE